MADVSFGGYTAPLSPGGRAGIVPSPPWHYSGDFLIAEYRTDPAAVVALLPDELEPAEDPAAVAAIFADWQSCSADLNELTDPIQSQYHEFFIVVGARFRGEPVSRCVYIWVDKDFSMYRGWIQGFPKKLGSIHITRLFASGKATPRLEPGARFGATCAANDRQIARMMVTLEHVSETGPSVNAPPMHNTRHFPAARALARPCSSWCAPAGETATSARCGRAARSFAFTTTRSRTWLPSPLARCCAVTGSHSGTPSTAWRSSQGTAIPREGDRTRETRAHPSRGAGSGRHA